ncbi:MAG: amidohydrolase family protein [Gemmatimonadota bacterium]
MVTGALALVPQAALSQATPLPAHVDRQGSDTLRLYYMGYAVGYESWQLTTGADGARSLVADLDYVDRGRRNRLRADLRLADDWSATRLTITRRSDSSDVQETRTERRGRTAIVDYRGRHDTVAVPPHVVAIAGTSPVTQHLALVRHWLARGRPATLAVIPGGPTNTVEVAWRGRDTLQVAGAPTILERYAVNGVVWGWESVWLDAAGRLAAFTTAGGGGLTFEAVRLPLDAFLPTLRASATHDRLAELAAVSRTVRPVASGTVALIGATLIDGSGRAAIPDAVIVVSGGRIQAAGPRASVTIPPQAQRIDVRGRTIVPGLWDMHTHLMQVEWAPVYLAAGVTTVRDMGNLTDFIVPFRAAVDAGRGLGPRMFLAGLIDGGGPDAFGAENAATPTEAREIVRRYHALGFEQMKLYSLLKPDVVAATTDEAHKLGMTVTGHVPVALTLMAAVDSGMDHIAHLPIRGDASSDSVKLQVAHLRERGTVMDPTVSWGELLQHSTAEPVATFQPGVAHLPPVLAQRINAMGAANVDPETAHARFARTLGVLRALHEAGVPIVAGTDEGVPGFSVYREVELFTQFGMTPLEAIQSASLVGARAMGAADSLGTLEPGKLADLIVLDGNPLEQISNIRRVDLVMKGGTLYRSRDIWKAIGFR